LDEVILLYIYPTLFRNGTIFETTFAENSIND